MKAKNRSAPDEKQSGAKGCVWTAGIVSLVLFLAFSVAITLWAVRESSDRKRVRSMLDALSDRGAPIDDASLDLWYRSHTDPADASAWQRILAEVSAKEFQEMCQGIEVFSVQAEGAGWTESGWLGEAAERNLIANTEDLRHRIHELSRKRVSIQFPIEFDAFNTLLPQAQQMRTVQRLLATEFQVAFADRDSGACRESIEAGLGLSHVFSNDPWMVSHLINVAHRSMAMQYIRQAVEYDVLNEKDLAKVMDRLSAETLPLDRWPFMIQGERASVLEAMKDPTTISGFVGAGSSKTFLSILAGTSSRSLRNLLEHFEVLESLDVSDIDRLQARVMEIENTLQLDIRNAGLLAITDWQLIGSLAPAASSLTVALIRDTVQERFTRHALAIRQFEKRFGRWPLSLDELQEVGFDSNSWKPWGGKPFGFRTEDGDAVLWATIPQDGATTAANPPKIATATGDDALRRNFYLRIRSSP